jgi:hypothetical protein
VKRRRRTATAAQVVIGLVATLLAGSASALGAAPTVVSGSSTVLGEGTVILRGAVLSPETSPEAVIGCHFEWGPSLLFGSTAPCTLEATEVPGTTGATYTATQLPAGTIYWRLVASTAEGTGTGAAQVLYMPGAVLAPASTPYPEEAPVQPERRSGGGRQHAPADPNDVGLHVAYCPPQAKPSSVRAHAAGTSEKGWPAKECLKMDKGPAGRSHTLDGQLGVHNWLLGGFGNDTIVGGDKGDVIWADYHPSGWPKYQVATIHAGNGRNVIYANDTVNYVWTGTNPSTIVHIHEDRGVVHCENPHQIVYTSHHALPHWSLPGCKRISFFSVGY